TIDLNIVVLPALDQKTKAEPLFDLAGGPGASSVDRADFYAGPGKEYRRGRDVVCVDQRGTGKSNRLSISREKTPQYYLSEMFPVDYVKEMRHALEKRADLTKYTTSIAMDDLDDVRTWLGYDRINLFGGSYGTQAALVYMRRHPDHVRSASLLAVAHVVGMPPHIDRSEEHTSELQSRGHLVCRLLLEKKKKTGKARGLVMIGNAGARGGVRSCPCMRSLPSQATKISAPATPPTAPVRRAIGSLGCCTA